MKNLRIAKEILRIAEDLVYADSDYIYDPDHRKHPGGGYHKTEKGWSKAKKKNDIDDREDIAKSLNTATDLLDKLSEDSNSNVRQNVGSNPNTSIDTLVKLSKDASQDVRLHVAINPNTPAETLDKLSEDESPFVKDCVARNLNTPIDTLNKIMKTDSTYIGLNAKKTKMQIVSIKLNDVGFDFSKLSPELRDKMKDWDAEDIAKFIGWLKEHKG